MAKLHLLYVKQTYKGKEKCEMHIANSAKLITSALAYVHEVQSHILFHACIDSNATVTVAVGGRNVRKNNRFDSSFSLLANEPKLLQGREGVTEAL